MDLKKSLAFLFFVFSFAILCRSLLLDFYPDFSVTYQSSKLALSGINPYVAGRGLFVPQVYPPFFMTFFSPVTLFPFLAAEKIWTVLSMIFLFASVLFIFKILNKNIFSSLGFLILGLVCFSFPVKFTLGMGQVNNLILFLTVLGIYFFQKKRSISSGLLFSLSLALKFFPIFIPIYLLLRRSWKILLVIIFSFALLYSIAFIFIDPKINFYFYKNVLPTLFSGYKTDYYNQSLAGFLGRSFSQDSIRDLLKYSISSVLFIVSFVSVYKELKNKELLNMILGLLITLNLLINNFSWQHHFVLSIFPFIVTLYYILDKKLSIKYIVLLFISYFLIAFNIKEPGTVAVILRSHVFFGALILWILQIFLIWRDSQKLGLNFPKVWIH